MQLDVETEVVIDHWSTSMGSHQPNIARIANAVQCHFQLSEFWSIECPNIHMFKFVAICSANVYFQLMRIKILACNFDQCVSNVTSLQDCIYNCPNSKNYQKCLHCHKTSQELRMLSSVTINCQVTKIVMNSGSQLSELYIVGVWKVTSL